MIKLKTKVFIAVILLASVELCSCQEPPTKGTNDSIKKNSLEMENKIIYDDRYIEKFLDSILVNFNEKSITEKRNTIKEIDSIGNYSDGAGSQNISYRLFELFNNDVNLFYSYLSTNPNSNIEDYLAFEICQNIGVDERYLDKVTIEKRLMSFVKSTSDKTVVDGILNKMVIMECE